MFLRLITLVSISIFSAGVSSQAMKVVTPGCHSEPVKFGINDLEESARCLSGCEINVTVSGSCNNKSLPEKPESFVISRSEDNITITGSDDVGTMYGCLELAERIKMDGLAALEITAPIVQSPTVRFRAINPFLVLPYEESEKDWWFLSEDYWRGYIDMLARARINWIDLHGMYDISTTEFPNIFPYFISSEKFPEVGVEPNTAKRNLDMLNKVMRMAKDRGISFALMSYTASWKGRGLRTPPYECDEENMTVYTREVVRKMIDACPDLRMIGFRIGESGMSESFYKKSYVPAIKEASRDIDLYARTWVADKPRILEIGSEFPGRYFIEPKYNGEQLGPPYIVAGGRMPGWQDYSYQDYYSYPRCYQIIYQIRANGTHRIFYWGNPELAARANECSLMGGAIGACVEPMDAYYPKYDYKHKKDSPNRWFEWNYQRDWYWYQCWGRTAYDPSLRHNHKLWTYMLADRYGEEVAEDVYEALNCSGRIVPDCYTSFALGPDHRSYATEYETGGTVAEWARRQPLDTQNIQPALEFAERTAAGDLSARARLSDMAEYIDHAAWATKQRVDAIRSKITDPSPELADLLTELEMLHFFGMYNTLKLRAVERFALMNRFNDTSVAPLIEMDLQGARKAWKKLAKLGDMHYRPFVEPLRMHTQHFTWSEEGKKLDGDIPALREAVERIRKSGKDGSIPKSALVDNGERPVVKSVSDEVRWQQQGKTKRLAVRVNAESKAGIASVKLKTKPLPSESYWRLAPMKREGDVWVGEAEVPQDGLMWCVEALDSEGNGALWPNFREETPYRIIEPWDAPRPKYDHTAALRAIPEVAASGEWSAITLISTREVYPMKDAPVEIHRGLLKPVEEGMNLVMLYHAPLSWQNSELSGGLDVDGNYSHIVRFVGKHPILDGVPEQVDEERIIRHSISGGEGIWTYLSDPPALAVRDYGKGKIILVQLDITHSMDDPGIVRLFKNIFGYARGGSDKPLLVIEHGTGSALHLFDIYGIPYKLLDECMGR